MGKLRRYYVEVTGHYNGRTMGIILNEDGSEYTGDIMPDEKQVKIVQITASERGVVGLGEDNKVYVWIQHGYDDVPHWELYNYLELRASI